MTETNQAFKCPFRKEENGEFADCYGSRCLAYSEFSSAVPFSPTKEPETIRTCRMMGVTYSPPLITGCGC